MVGIFPAGQAFVSDWVTPSQQKRAFLKPTDKIRCLGERKYFLIFRNSPTRGF